jgi:hypothetical protein
VPGLQKGSESKIVGRQYIWGQDPADYSKQILSSELLKMKKGQNMKITTDVVIAVTAALYLVRWRNHQCSFFRHEGYGYVPANFEADKSHIVVQGQFCGGVKKQALPTPHRKTFDGGEGTKTIRQPYYLLNMATVDLFLFHRGEVEAGKPLTAQGSLMKNLEGVTRISSKNESTAAFQRYLDRCEG